MHAQKPLHMNKEFVLRPNAARVYLYVCIVSLMAFPATAGSDRIKSPAPMETVTAQPEQIASENTLLSLKQIQQHLQALHETDLTQSRQIHQLKQQLQTIQTENRWLKMGLLGLSVMLAFSSYFFADWLKRKTVQSLLTDKSNPDVQIHQTKKTDSARSTDLKATAHTNLASKTTAEIPSASVAKHHPEATLDTRPDSPSNPVTTAHTNAALVRLQKHVVQHPKQSARIWLYLLDKQKNEGLQADYEATAVHCKMHFNLLTERFYSGSPANEQVSLESFPRLINGLYACWGTPAALSFLDDLIYNTRPMPRIGFNRYVFEELLLLRDIAALAQNIPRHTQKSIAAKRRNDLKVLSQIEQDISGMSAPVMSAFQYWSAFSFVLDEPPSTRKLA